MGNRLNVSHGAPRTKPLSSLTGLEVKQFFSTSGRGRSIFLDIPLYRSGVSASLRRFFALSSAIALNIHLKGLPDSSDPIRQHGLQGQVLAITTNHSPRPSASISSSAFGAGLFRS